MSVPLPQLSPMPSAAMDQRVILHGLSWKDYESMLAIRGDQAGVRMTYLEGERELMSPSVSHEGIKTRLARWLEAYAEETDIVLEGFGSWSVRSRPRKRGAEADECYILGVPGDEPKRPDIAIEVVGTSGGLDKLEVYRGLGVPEAWIWEHRQLTFHRLQGDAYVAASRSERLPAFDPALILRCMEAPSQTQAARELPRALRNH